VHLSGFHYQIRVARFHHHHGQSVGVPAHLLTGPDDQSELPGVGHLAALGLASSTLLTVLVIPAIYLILRNAERVQ
jgi:hypothetical protein